MTSISSQIHPEKVCPYLGIITDKGTANAFPTAQNYCHQCVPPNTPSISHQREFCLAAKHIVCPLYLNEVVGPMPREMQSAERKSGRRKKRSIAWTVATILIVLAAAGLWFTQPYWRPIIVPTGLQPAADTATPSPILATATPVPSLTATAVPPTATSTPLPRHLPETYVGPNTWLLLHKVVDGESLISIADHFQTSTDAIKAINVNTTVWAGTVLVIPVGQTDVSSLPLFNVVAVDKSGTTLDQLAARYSTTADLLAQYNYVPVSYTFEPGEYVLVPVAQTTPTILP
jgi:LysM repeat protein